MREKELAKKIIEEMRQNFNWKPTHSQMKYPKGTIGYFDTKEKDSYFMLKWDNVEYINYRTGYAIDMREDVQLSNFCLLNWLKEIEIIVSPDQTIIGLDSIIINGVKYVKDVK